MEKVHGVFNDVNDELEPIPVNRREQSIPQYVPKTYTRESKSEPINDKYYPSDDDLQPVNGSVKGAANTGEKKNNTTLWIIIGVAAALLIAGCCAISAFFGILGLMVK